tara:strand:+ start:406 stop:579 length:174 start_codon:yes stop_codon:yes gene_type:complete
LLLGQIITIDVSGCRETVVYSKDKILIPAKNTLTLTKAFIKFPEKKRSYPKNFDSKL